MPDIKVIKSLDVPKRSGLSLDDVERLQIRYQTASGHQNGVIKEVFRHLIDTVRNQEKFEKRLSALEGR